MQKLNKGPKRFRAKGCLELGNKPRKKHPVAVVVQPDDIPTLALRECFRVVVRACLVKAKRYLRYIQNSILQQVLFNNFGLLFDSTFNELAATRLYS